MTKTFLHVGCGRRSKANTTQGFKADDWAEIRFDLDEAVEPDIVGTMTDMSRVASGSMDAVFSSHNIEHLYPHEVPAALAEFRRVLKPDGFAVITCPDLQSLCAHVANGNLTDPLYVSSAGPVAPIDILFGFRPDLARGNSYMAHRGGFTKKSLSDALLGAGFASATSFARPAFIDLWALACKSPASEAALRDLVAQHFPLQNASDPT